MSEQVSKWSGTPDVACVSDVFWCLDFEELVLRGTRAEIGRIPLPDLLLQAVFEMKNQPETGANRTPSTTYVLLDAAKYPFIPEVLETSDLPHRCLFKGKAAEELRDVSPWLVELVPKNRLTRALFSQGEGPNNLWRFNLGPIILSAANFEAVWRHLRKFVRLKRAEEDAWFYFRFWETHALHGLATSNAAEPLALAQALLAPIDGEDQSWIMRNAEGARAKVWSVRDPEQAHSAVPLLHSATIDALAGSTMRAQMASDISKALLSAPDNVRDAYAAEPRLADLWAALFANRFDLSAHRIEAISGYLTMVLRHRQDEAWRILMRQDQGPKVRLWHLQRSLEDPA